MIQDQFEIERTRAGVFWVSREDDVLSFHKTTDVANDESHGELLKLDLEVMRNLLLWADGPRSVTVSMTGPLAQQVRDMAKHLGLTPEMFVWHATKVYLDIGTESL